MKCIDIVPIPLRTFLTAGIVYDCSYYMFKTGIPLTIDPTSHAFPTRILGFAIMSSKGSSSAASEPSLESITIRVRKPIIPSISTTRNFLRTDIGSLFTMPPRFDPVSLDLEEKRKQSMHPLSS